MISRERMLREFQTLAAFDSESFHEKEIAEYLFHKLEELGLTVSMDDAGHRLCENEKAAGNIYGFLKGNAAGESLLFSGHMDTVSPGIGKKVMVREDGRVTSDGTTVLGSDDITALVAILEMLTVIREDGLSHPDIEVALFVAEELHGRGSAVFDYSKIKSKLAYVLDLDGPVGTVANCAPSILRFSVTVKGKSAHAGFEPENGISAIAAAAHAIDRLKLGRVDALTTANVGTITGGTGRNIIPGILSAEGEVRSLSSERAVEVVEEIRQTFLSSAKEFGAEISFESEEMVRTYHVDPDSPVVRRYAEALKSLGYGNAKIITTFGGSDNNNFNKMGIPGIVISNAMNQVHTVNEYFDLDELEKSTRIVLQIATESPTDR